jgi:competence protein ComGC
MINKKGYFKDVGIIVLSLVVLLMLIMLITQLLHGTNEYVADAGCVASIKQHISAVEAFNYGRDKVEENLGVASFLISVDDMKDIPPIECDTRLIESNAKTSEEAEKEILKQLVNTWSLFKEGKAMLYPDIEDQNFCFVYSVLDFKKNLSVNLPNASKNINIKKLNKFYDGDATTVWEYFNGAFLTRKEFINAPDNVAANYRFNINTHGNIFNFAVMTMLGKTKEADFTEDFINSANVGNEYFFDTSQPIAIIFQQFHNYDEVYTSSLVYAMPYTSEAMQEINCQHMPFEFEKFGG